MFNRIGPPFAAGLVAVIIFAIGFWCGWAAALHAAGV